jgi:hypothetical protein
VWGRSPAFALAWGGEQWSTQCVGKFTPHLPSILIVSWVLYYSPASGSLALHLTSAAVGRGGALVLL